MKRTRRLSTKLLLVLLPVIIIGLVVLVSVSILFSRTLIDSQVEEQMKLSLLAESTKIQNEIQSVASLAENISDMVSYTYQSTSLEEYEKMLGRIIYTNEFVLGSGIWFEPYEYDKDEKFIGPYIYKEGDKPVTTYAYSNAEYDYFTYEFYTGAALSKKEAVFTDPYYDPETDLVMSSCSAPIIDANNKFVGVITVDIELSSIQNIAQDIHVGNTGKAIVLDSTGRFIYQDGKNNILDKSITEETNTSYAKTGSEMLANETGNTTYYDGKEKIHLYYEKIDTVNWPLGLTMNESELTEPVIQLSNQLMLICGGILIVIIIIVLLQVSSISRNIKKVMVFSKELANGNFTVEQLKAKRKDEIGSMGRSLNHMYESNKDMIQKIAAHSSILGTSSEELHSSAGKLKHQIKKIEKLMKEVNNDMSTSSASTQEVNASIEEVNSSVAILTDESSNSTNLAREIKVRAADIQDSSKKSFDLAQNLTEEHQTNLNTSIEKANVVNAIGEMAEVISEIASQINLLSLNASIEAARAGEQGKGFAVVAGEIGKLAGETSQAVERIKDTIQEVQGAFDDLLKQSKAMLGFVTDTVSPDYNNFLEAAKQYGKDAVLIEEFSSRTSYMVEEIEKVINDVSQAVQSIAIASQNTVDNSTVIMNAVESVSEESDQITEMSESQEAVASELSGVVKNFNL